MTGKARPVDIQKVKKGLPMILPVMRLEKRNATVAFKVEPSLKKLLAEYGGSSLVYTLVLESLNS